MNLLEMFSSPKIIGVVGDPNSGKSMTLYWLVKELRERYNFNLFSYGLRIDMGEQKIYSIERLETIRNSVIILDEFVTLFDVDDRKNRRMIERTLRLIFHNNNVIVLCGLPENYKKFLASKLDAVVYKRSTIGDFINGSRTKALATNYRGAELGAAILNVARDTALVYDGADYSLVHTPYLLECDTKAGNASILREKTSEIPSIKVSQVAYSVMREKESVEVLSEIGQGE